MAGQKGVARTRLARLREQLDAVDSRLVTLLARRARLAKRAIAARAAVTGKRRLRDPRREAAILAAWRRQARRAGLDPTSIARALRAVLALSRR